MKKLLLSYVCCGMLFTALGCGGGFEDPDGTRGTAKPISVCGVDTDLLNPDGNDFFDYRVFQIPESGVATIIVHWDNPRNIEASVSVMDRFGIILDSRDRNPNRNNDVISRPLVAGVYYIEIKGIKGQSVYSLETLFTSETGVACAEEDDPIPYCIELMEGDYVAQADSSGGAPAAAARQEPPPPAPPAPPEPAAVAQAPVVQTIGAQETFAAPAPPAPPADEWDAVPEPPGPKTPRQAAVLRVAPSGTGTRVTIAMGSSDNVRKGVRGHLVDGRGKPISGGQILVEQVYPNSCVGLTRLSSDALFNMGGAVLRVPQ